MNTRTLLLTGQDDSRNDHRAQRHSAAVSYQSVLGVTGNPVMAIFSSQIRHILSKDVPLEAEVIGWTTFYEITGISIRPFRNLVSVPDKRAFGRVFDRAVDCVRRDGAGRRAIRLCRIDRGHVGNEPDASQRQRAYPHFPRPIASFAAKRKLERTSRTNAFVLPALASSVRVRPAFSTERLTLPRAMRDRAAVGKNSATGRLFTSRMTPLGDRDRTSVARGHIGGRHGN